MAKRRKPHRNPDHGRGLLKREAGRPVILFAEQDAHPDAVQLLNFEVTWDTISDPAVDALPKATRDRMPQIFDLVHRKPKGIIPELRDLTAQYPGVPCFTNWLINALRCGTQADRQEALELGQRLFHERPGYFFARTTLADLWLDEGETGKAAELLFGPECVLTRFYPGRDIFHISEIRHWAYLCAQVKILLGEPDVAEGYRDMLEELEPHSPPVRHLNKLLRREKSMFTRLIAWVKKLSERAKASE